MCGSAQNLSYTKQKNRKRKHRKTSLRVFVHTCLQGGVHIPCSRNDSSMRAVTNSISAESLDSVPTNIWGTASSKRWYCSVGRTICANKITPQVRQIQLMCRPKVRVNQSTPCAHANKRQTRERAAGRRADGTVNVHTCNSSRRSGSTTINGWCSSSLMPEAKTCAHKQSCQKS